jgi:hypothetical protein
MSKMAWLAEQGQPPRACCTDIGERERAHSGGR